MLTSLKQRTWSSSTRLAALSGVLAKHCSSLRPESATLAGLLQDIGVLPILNVLNRYHEQLSNETHVLSAIERFAPPVGMILLTRWGFDADMVEVARSRGNWLRDPQPAADLADVVLVARLHANITSSDLALPTPIGARFRPFVASPTAHLSRGVHSLTHRKELPWPKTRPREPFVN